MINNMTTFLLSTMLVFLMFGAITMLILLISNYKLFTKAGEDGWKSLIPIYGTYVRIRIAFGEGKEWLLAGIVCSIIGQFVGYNSALGFLLWTIGIIINIYINYGFIRRFTDTGMAIASLFFSIIIYPIVAFSRKYEYNSQNIIEY